MALGLTLSCGVALVLMTALGLWRGLLPSVLALLGTLVGAVLADIWAPIWGGWLAQQLGVANRNALTWAIASLTFLLTLLVVGFGSSLLRRAPAPTAAQDQPATRRTDPLPHLAGGLLGLFNGVLVAGFLLRYATDLLRSEALGAAILTSPLARWLRDGLGWAFLIPAVLVGVAVLVRAAVLLVRGSLRRRKIARAAAATVAAQQKAASSTPAAPATPAPVKPATSPASEPTKPAAGAPPPKPKV